MIPAVHADLTFTGQHFERGVTVLLDNQGGIAGVSRGGPPPEGTLFLPGRALLPGMVNTHSHAFQRLIRGRAERPGPPANTDDFWSWREAMYSAVLNLEAHQLEAVSALAFMEMLNAGITTVGEFHYVHNLPSGAVPENDDEDPDHAVLRGSRNAGIRITLQRVAYGRAGHQRSLDPRQRRFVEPSVGAYLNRLRRLRETWEPRTPRVRIEPALHSVRAVDARWIAAVAAQDRRGAALFVHACEQPREVQESMAEHGAPPIAALARCAGAGTPLAVVHGIHMTEEEIALLAGSGSSLCVCPATERNLGDGSQPMDRLIAAGVEVHVGSDSNAVIDFFEEMRTVEYNERMKHLGRALCHRRDSGGAPSPALFLFRAAVQNGARALGLRAADLSGETPGSPADFFSVDLESPALLGAPEETLLDALVFSGCAPVVRDAFVAGEVLVRDGRHVREGEIVAAYREVAAALPGVNTGASSLQAP